ncbi:MAG: hypothetical protein AB1Z31_00855 [Desulfobacterales bacterium]
MKAVVNTPIPVKASLTATALDPKIMHKKTVNIPALSESSWLAGCVSVISSLCDKIHPYFLLIDYFSLFSKLSQPFVIKYNSNFSLMFMQDSGGNYTTGEGLARRYHRKKIQTY